MACAIGIPMMKTCTNIPVSWFQIISPFLVTLTSLHEIRNLCQLHLNLNLHKSHIIEHVSLVTIIPLTGTKKPFK